MDEREKQNPRLSDDELFGNLLLDEEPKNAPLAESEVDDVLDMLDFETPARDVLSTVPERKADKEFDLEDLTLDSPVKSAIPTSDDTDDVLKYLDETTAFNVYHPWRISLYEKLPFICEAQDGEKVFLIGYQNGQTAREKETHFYQHETDPIPYAISLDPDPHFISYSFFYGFFRQTLEKMCRKNMATDELRVAVKKKITDDFFKKYTFDFRNNPQLLQSMREYVDTMTENIMEAIEKKREEYSDGCR